MLMRACAAVSLMVAASIAHGQCEETAKLVRPDGTNSDDFGASVAIGPHGIGVGAPGVPEGGTVECYQLVEGTWTHVQSINAPEDEADFGGAMDMSGDVLVVGDQFADDSAGAAHVYRYDGSWVFEQTLEGDTPAFGDKFGLDVAVDGDRIVVGAFGDGEHGLAYVFEFDGGSWSKVQVLEPSSPSALSTFGTRVDIAGDVVAVSDWRDNDDAGAVYAYRKVGDTYVEQGKLIASSAADFDRAGEGLSTDGQRIVFGAIFSDVAEFQAGAAFVFVWNGAAWVEEQTLVAGDAGPLEQFGDDVHVEGDRILVGALDNENGLSAGAVYVYERIGGSWVQTEKLMGSDADAVSFFGTSIGASGSKLVFGAYAKEAAYAFDCDRPRTHLLAFGIDDNGLIKPMRGDLSAMKIAEGFEELTHIDVATTVKTYEYDTDNPLDGFEALESIKETLTEAIGEEGTITPDDTVVIYIASHGSFTTPQGGDEAFVCQQTSLLLPFVCEDFDTDEVLILGSDGQIWFDDEMRAFFDTPAWNEVNKLFIVDACFAGGFWGSTILGDSGDLATLPKSAIIAASDEASFSYGEVEIGRTYTSLAINWALGELADEESLTFDELSAKVEEANSWIIDTYADGGTFEGIMLGGEAYDFRELYGEVGEATYAPMIASTPDFSLEPGVSPCLADCNADGVLNILDFVCFQGRFQAGEIAADCNADGVLNILDFVCFQALFQVGCP